MHACFPKGIKQDVFIEEFYSVDFHFEMHAFSERTCNSFQCCKTHSFSYLHFLSFCKITLLMMIFFPSTAKKH